MPSGDKGRLRILVVGPIGERPWVAMSEFAARLARDGNDVIVNGDPDEVLPALTPLPPRLGSVVNSAPVLLAWLARMMWHWRRTARRSLRAAGVDRILVWDDVLAMLCCLARPRGVEVMWAAGAPEGKRLHQRVLRAAVARRAERVTSAWDDDAPVSNASLIPGWVVFGSARTPDAATLTKLRERAAGEPALALVFDARRHDDVQPATMSALVEACDPRAVWWVGDDEWVARLGGVPADAVDPCHDGELDHRHHRAQAAGARVLVL